MNDPQPNTAKPTTPKADLSEGQYLADQANQACAAIGAAFAALKSDLSKGVDPKILTKQHPWMVVGSAAVAGFVAANALVPSKEEQALKKLERIERALHPHPGPRPAATESPERKSMAGRVFAELLSAVKPALSSAIAAYAAAQSTQPSNGHAPPTAAAGSAAYYQPDADSDQPI